MKIKTSSFRFAEEVLNSKLNVKNEILGVVSKDYDFNILSRPSFNELIRKEMIALGWQDQPTVFNDVEDPSARLDFLKERIGVEVEFGHASFLGIDLLKFQVASYSGINKIDLGVYIVTTTSFQKLLENKHGKKWEGSLSYEKVLRYLPHFKSAIQVPIFVIGIDG
ncbi:MAG TPA: BglII/BstYI family type II restriction endonuclease [Methanomassiliicoccales archaeon]|nr:BglII/BstYI family type II restriction endonuclease [Methanomassiliicoccales archaeon]